MTPMEQLDLIKDIQKDMVNPLYDPSETDLQVCS